MTPAQEPRAWRRRIWMVAATAIFGMLAALPWLTSFGPLTGSASGAVAALLATAVPGLLRFVDALGFNLSTVPGLDLLTAVAIWTLPGMRLAPPAAHHKILLYNSMETANLVVLALLLIAYVRRPGDSENNPLRRSRV